MSSSLKTCCTKGGKPLFVAQCIRSVARGPRWRPARLPCLAGSRSRAPPLNTPQRTQSGGHPPGLAGIHLRPQSQRLLQGGPQPTRACLSELRVASVLETCVANRLIRRPSSSRRCDSVLWVLMILTGRLGLKQWLTSLEVKDAKSRPPVPAGSRCSAPWPHSRAQPGMCGSGRQTLCRKLQSSTSAGRWLLDASAASRLGRCGRYQRLHLRSFVFQQSRRRQTRIARRFMRLQ